MVIYGIIITRKKVIDMGTAITDSLIHPKEIVNHINSNKKNLFYFLFLVLLFILPNLIYVITSGGFSKADINYLVEMISEEQSIPYNIVDNELVFVGETNNNGVLISSKSSEIAFLFTDLPLSSLKKAFNDASIKESGYSISSPIIITFSRNNISIGLGSKYSSYFNLKELVNYRELDLTELKLDNLNDLDVQNKLGSIFNFIIKKYHTELVLLTIPMLIISGLVTFFMLLIVPTLICYLFNRGLNIKFWTIFKLAIYSFTPFVISTLISLGNSGSILAMVFEFISLIYLFISISSYYIQNNGGHHEL